jgi:hypothetical protein
MTALEKTLAEIGDAFRPFRKEYERRILTACRIHALVLSHRYTFQQALEKMEARTDWMLEAFEIIATDNVALNLTYETEKHRLYDHEQAAWAWLKRITGQE